MITVSDMSAGYHGTPVLEGISFTLEEGRVLAVLGSNGAGKTTLLRVVSGLLPAWTGSIRFRDEMIGGRNPSEIVALGVAQVPEGRRIFPGLSVKHNLRLGAYLLKDKRRIRENLDWVYALFPVLKERQKQVATTLSGGEQQMLAIARALMSQPSVLLLDEPTMGLAPVVVERLLTSLAQLREANISMLLVEQNAAFAMDLADHLLVLQSGEIVASGPKEEMSDRKELVSAYLGGI